ncbi:MAG: hypothetical protein JWO19_836 [Bryobacterales bacterium]|nr:hypothetical protein [Bryobacterales bacterium]
MAGEPAVARLLIQLRIHRPWMTGVRSPVGVEPAAVAEAAVGVAAVVVVEIRAPRKLPNQPRKVR